MSIQPDAVTTAAVRRLAPAVGVVLVLAGLTLFLRASPHLCRPLTQDEVATARGYASLDYHASMRQIRGTQRLNAPRLLRGWARCFVNPWDPNNHIVNSLGISLSVFLAGVNEWSVRLPALVGSLVLLVAVCLSALRQHGSLVWMTFCGLVVACHPYFVQYGQTARGYSITLALLALHALALDSRVTGARRLGQWWTLGCAVLGWAIFLNMASAVVVWLVPAYAAALLITCLRALQGLRAGSPERPCEPVGRAGRGGVSRLMAAVRDPVVQELAYEAVLAIGACCIFVLCNLGQFVRAQGKYGVGVAGAGEAGRFLAMALGGLMPGGWRILLLVGLAGCILMTVPRWAHWYGVAAVLSVALLCAYGWIGGKMPYGRTLGLWILFCLWGGGRVWVLVTKPGRGRGLRLVSLGAQILVLVSFSSWLVVSALLRRGEAWQPSYNDAAKSVYEYVRSEGLQPVETLIPLPHVFGEEMRLYLPEEEGYYTWGETSAGVLVLICERGEDGVARFRCKTLDRAKQEFDHWEPPAWFSEHSVAPMGRFVIYRLRLRLVSREQTPPEGAFAVLWRPAPTSLIDPAAHVCSSLVRGTAFRDLRMVATPGRELVGFVGNEEEEAVAVLAVSSLLKAYGGRSYWLVRDPTAPLGGSPR